jgi:ribosomal protein S18 acetylase RimI-like enzyme
MEIIEKNVGYKATKIALMEGETELGFLTYGEKNPPYEDYVEVLYLRVNPSYRRRGYGRILMDKFFSNISSYVGDVMLYATANYDVGSLCHVDKALQIPQDKLEEFYRKYGFKKVDPWKNEISPRMRMTKS